MNVPAHGKQAGSPIVRLAVEGALVGVVAGVLVIQRADLDRLALVVSVLVAVAAGTGLAVLLVGRRQPPPENEPGDAAPLVPQRVDATPARLVLGTGGSAATGRWWDQSPVRHARTPVSAPKSVRPAAPELAGYVASARVVQCPRCGAFRIDMHQSAGVFAFRCRVDDHRWEWQPGASWPATVVLSRAPAEQA
jgi:hypothetical protein